jgi:hypothetical protein
MPLATSLEGQTEETEATEEEAEVPTMITQMAKEAEEDQTMQGEEEATNTLLAEPTKKVRKAESTRLEAEEDREEEVPEEVNVVLEDRIP